MKQSRSHLDGSGAPEYSATEGCVTPVLGDACSACVWGHSPSGKRLVLNSPEIPAGVDVLVVDDEEANRRSLAEIVRTAGFSVREAENGLVALGHVHSERIGMVLLDVRMPVLDGLSFLDRIEEPPPIVLLTAQEFDDEIQRRMSKVAGCLQKPCDANTLLTMVGESLRSGAS